MPEDYLISKANEYACFLYIMYYPKFKTKEEVDDFISEATWLMNRKDDGISH